NASMLAPTSSSSLVSQESFSPPSAASTSASSSNATVIGDSSVNSKNNLSECLTTKATARLRRRSTVEHAYLTQAAHSPDANNNTNNSNSPQPPLRRSPRFKSKRQLQQQIASSSADNLSLQKNNSALRLRNNTKQVHQTSLTSSQLFSS
ncbi:3999_t:CDS:2, partial [Dentiscutata heterogama]